MLVKKKNIKLTTNKKIDLNSIKPKNILCTRIK